MHFMLNLFSIGFVSIKLLLYVFWNSLQICLGFSLDLFEPLRYCVCYRKSEVRKMAKRRPSGDGMVRLKKENQWEGRIVVGHKQNGDSIFRYAYGKTQKEMIQKLNALKLQYQDADLNEDSNITLSEWLDKWITELMPQAVRPTTLKGFELICRCYIKPYLGDKKIAFITTNDVQKMYAKLKKEGRINKHPVHGHKLADNMIIKIHSTLHLAMETAIAKNLIAKNPTQASDRIFQTIHGSSHYGRREGVADDHPAPAASAFVSAGLQPEGQCSRSILKVVVVTVVKSRNDAVAQRVQVGVNAVTEVLLRLRCEGQCHGQRDHESLKFHSR